MIVAAFGRNRTRLTGRLAFLFGLPRFALLEAMFGAYRPSTCLRPVFPLIPAVILGLDPRIGPSGRAINPCVENMAEKAVHRL